MAGSARAREGSSHGRRPQAAQPTLSCPHPTSATAVALLCATASQGQEVHSAKAFETAQMSTGKMGVFTWHGRPGHRLLLHGCRAPCHPPTLTCGRDSVLRLALRGGRGGGGALGQAAAAAQQVGDHCIQTAQACGPAGLSGQRLSCHGLFGRGRGQQCLRSRRGRFRSGGRRQSDVINTRPPPAARQRAASACTDQQRRDRAPPPAEAEPAAPPAKLCFSFGLAEKQRQQAAESCGAGGHGAESRACEQQSYAGTGVRRQKRAEQVV